jgi:EmrB/QacA subfamily drug resistance transporter
MFAARMNELRTPDSAPTGEQARAEARSAAAVPGTSGLMSVRPPSSAEAPALAHRDVVTVFIGLMLCIFIAALNQTIIAPALPTIGREFNDFESLSWLVTAYLLTSTAVAPLYGKLSDIYGRRRMMLIALSIFTAGAAMCALAPSMIVLVLGRAVQGIGGGALLPLAQTIIADCITPRERGRYQAYIGIAWVGAGIGGPILGGVFAGQLHWSLVFWLNVPLGLAAAWMANWTLKKLPRHERPHKLDLIGAVLLMAAAVPLLLALTWGGVRFAWTSPMILALIAGSAILSLGFALRLTRAAEPFLPIPVLANPVARMGTLGGTAALGTAIGITIMVPLYFELVHGLSASAAGLALMPMVALSTPGSISSGRVMLRFNRYKWWPMLWLVVSISGFLWLSLHPATSLGVAIIVLSIANIGIGTVYPVCTVSVQNAVAPHEVGIAMGAMNFFRSLGSALTVAAMGAIVLAGLGRAPERGMHGVDGGASAAAANFAGADLAGTFGWVFFSAAVFLAIGWLSLLIMEERPLRGPAGMARAEGAADAATKAPAG